MATLLGAIDSIGNGPVTAGGPDTDISDIISDKAYTKIVELVAGVKTEGAGLEGFPERATSAWVGEEEYAGPGLGEGTGSKIGEPELGALGAPEEDPIQSIEEKLARMSEV